MKKNYTKLIIWLSLFCLPGFSCKKFLDVGAPKTEAVSAVIFNSNTTATSAMLSIYGDFMVTATCIDASFLLSQSSDELKSYAPAPRSNYYTNNLTATDNVNFWGTYYRNIYRANLILEGLEHSTSVNASVARQLKGEALFLRAFFHFYLVNLYGAVPYLTTTNYEINNSAVRAPINEVYTQIIRDFNLSKTLLGYGFPDAKNVTGLERVRPNKAAAHTMLARTYLYTQDWANAKLEADSVISRAATYKLLDDMDLVFKKNSLETIWQLMPSTIVNPNGFDAPTFVLTSAPSAFFQSTAITDKLWNALAATDKRKISWMGTITAGLIPATYHFPYKYRANVLTMPTTEYFMVLRLAEVYLIRAEAQAQIGNLGPAIADLDALKRRAGLNLISVTQPGISKADLLAEVANERFKELFAEWGHRWLDLKRTGQADEVLRPLKGSSWQTTDQLFPIPNDQITLSPGFTGQQNPGYN